MEFYFLLISSGCFTCAIFVIGIVNPIHSILLLIIVFFLGSVLLLLLNLEFFAFIFLIVYVGAIAVLFLFMVMTLDIKILNITQKIRDFFSYKIFLFIFFFILFILLINDDLVFIHYASNWTIFSENFVDYSKFLKTDSHLEIIGKTLFKEYVVSFLFCGFILFISMIGAIVITIDDFALKTIKQQDLITQALRNNSHSIFNFKFY
jgi:NADH-quinone oxidoreductase subunit J